jgi:Tfp pilus assembly protein PilN
MINLLPIESQRYYRAARLNLLLRMYLVILGLLLLSVVGIFGTGYYLTVHERAIAEQELQQQQSETASYASVRSEAKDFASNLKIAKSILSQETLYSDMIVQIAQTLPSSAVLTSLSLDATSFQKPVTVSARVKAKTDALVLKSTLENSSLFEDVSLSNITETPPGATGNRIIRDFPITVSLSAKLSKQPASGGQR